MDDQPFFALSSYHVGMALVGAGIIAAFWLPRFLSVSIGVQTGPPIGAQKGPPFTMAQG